MFLYDILGIKCKNILCAKPTVIVKRAFKRTGVLQFRALLRVRLLFADSVVNTFSQFTGIKNGFKSHIEYSNCLLLIYFLCIHNVYKFIKLNNI